MNCLPDGGAYDLILILSPNAVPCEHLAIAAFHAVIKLCIHRISMRPEVTPLSAFGFIPFFAAQRSNQGLVHHLAG